jgi:midasin
MLNERADVIDMKLHPEFRVFMCMNPPYSSAGKKQLPYSLRSKLLELYVPEMENESDIWHIIDSYTKRSSLQEQHKRTILQFYV